MTNPFDLSPREKTCMFCGQKPSDQNKEHIIPRWLLELTGDPNRKVNLGINWLQGKERQFAFSHFQFPACESCNEKYSVLEGQASRVIKNILSYGQINGRDSDILLDWLDKVRVGLWIAYQYLDKNMFSINPEFHINQRIAKKDRCVFIYKISERQQGINFIGATLPAFQFTPSCFGLRINDFFFFNISYDQLFSWRLGFPAFEKISFVNVGDDKNLKMTGEPTKGTGRIKFPIIRRSLPKHSMGLYQPCFGDGALPQEFLDDDYVKKYSYDWEQGRGGVFVDSNTNVRFIEKDESLTVSDHPRYTPKETKEHLFTEVLHFQNHLMEMAQERMDKLDKETRQQFNRLLKKHMSINNLFIRNGFDES